MKPEDRIRYYRRAASRAEVEGNLRLARILRLMAAEARPLDEDLHSGFRILAGLEE